MSTYTLVRYIKLPRKVCLHFSTFFYDVFGEEHTDFEEKLQQSAINTQK